MLSIKIPPRTKTPNPPVTDPDDKDFIIFIEKHEARQEIEKTYCKRESDLHDLDDKRRYAKNLNERFKADAAFSADEKNFKEQERNFHALFNEMHNQAPRLLPQICVCIDRIKQVTHKGQVYEFTELKDVTPDTYHKVCPIAFRKVV